MCLRCAHDDMKLHDRGARMPLYEHDLHGQHGPHGHGPDGLCLMRL